MHEERWCIFSQSTKNEKPLDASFVHEWLRMGKPHMNLAKSAEADRREAYELLQSIVANRLLA